MAKSPCSRERERESGGKEGEHQQFHVKKKQQEPGHYRDHSEFVLVRMPITLTVNIRLHLKGWLIAISLFSF